MSDTGMGLGKNQRAQIKMSDAEVTAFLNDRKIATMCTSNADGSIHAVAMWYGIVDGCVAFETKLKSQKVANLRRNPNLTVSLEAGEAYEELRGVSLVGKAEFIEGLDAMWPLGVSVWERYQGEYSDDMRPFIEMMLNKRLVVKLNVERTITWDHRKLAG